MSRAVEYFGGDELPASVWESKYALRDKNDNQLESSPDEMHRRLAKEFARIEKGKFKEPLTEEFIYSLLKDFGPIIPQGGPMAGIGSEKFVSLSNCYVVDPPEDSYGGICHTDEQLVQICKRRGGVGTDLSKIRPAMTMTSNAARKATGVVTFAERYSHSIREVAQEGRRGALMLTLNVHHPEVLDFARAKLDPTKITGANVSVRLTDEFLNAVTTGTTYEQRWPVDSSAPVISKQVDAKGVWQELIRCAWERAEPGLIFWDRILSESPADCYASAGFRTISTNPCAELPLCVLDSCRLLLLNLFCFVKFPFTHLAYFDFAAFSQHARYAQRLMDDLVDLEMECIHRIQEKVRQDPEPLAIKQRELALWHRVYEKCRLGRRTGTGITALGDVMAAIGIQYGSARSIWFTEEIYRTLKLACYRESVEMAKELGPFPLWNSSAEKANPFLLRIRDDDPVLYEDMQQYGRRNIALLTTAPAGTVSIAAGPGPYFGTSSGIEPVFKAHYVRRTKINHADKNARVDSTDANDDRWQHFDVYHPKLRLWMKVTGETDWTKSPYYGCCAEDLDWQQRVKLQAAAQKHVDHAISSTLNLPKDVSVEKVAEIYETAWKAGCKGITVYRDGCRDGVLVDAAPAIKKTDAPKRPTDLPCKIHHCTVHKEPFVVVVGLLGEEPYEVFAFGNGGAAEVGRQASEGLLRKVKRGKYDLLLGDQVVEDIGSFVSDNKEALTRMTSTALRHGAEIGFVTHQLEKVKGNLQSFAKAMARVLKKYIKDGTAVKGEACEQCGREDNLRRQEGCLTCACGWSKCS